MIVENGRHFYFKGLYLVLSTYLKVANPNLNHRPSLLYTTRDHGKTSGKTIELDRHPNPTTNPNPSPYLVVFRYSSLARLPNRTAGSGDCPALPKCVSEWSTARVESVDRVAFSPSLVHHLHRLKGRNTLPMFTGREHGCVK